MLVTFGLDGLMLCQLGRMAWFCAVWLDGFRLVLIELDGLVLVPIGFGGLIVWLSC